MVHIKRDHSTLRIVMVAMNGTVKPTTLLSQKREKLSTTRRSSDQTIQRVLLIRRRRYCGDRDSIRFPDHHRTWGASGTVKTISGRPLMQNKAYMIAWNPRLRCPNSTRCQKFQRVTKSFNKTMELWYLAYTIAHLEDQHLWSHILVLGYTFPS